MKGKTAVRWDNMEPIGEFKPLTYEDAVKDLEKSR